MDVRQIALRYALIRAEIERRMTPVGKWRAMPGLLDEMNHLRTQYQRALAVSTSKAATS